MNIETTTIIFYSIIIRISLMCAFLSFAIVLHELGHYWSLKRKLPEYALDTVFIKAGRSSDFVGIRVGEPYHYDLLTKKEKSAVLGSGILAGVIPILLLLLIDPVSWVGVYIAYIFLSLRDIKRLRKYSRQSSIK